LTWTWSPLKREQVLDVRARLRCAAALGFVTLRAAPRHPGARGAITVGMARQGYALQLTRYDEKGWRATFYTTGALADERDRHRLGTHARRARCRVRRGRL